MGGSEKRRRRILFEEKERVMERELKGIHGCKQAMKASALLYSIDRKEISQRSNQY